MLDEPASDPFTVDRSPATGNNMSGQLQSSRRQIEPKQGKATSQNGDNESLYLHSLKHVVWELLRSLFVCMVCVKINNVELVFNAFSFQNSYYVISV